MCFRGCCYVQRQGALSVWDWRVQMCHGQLWTKQEAGAAGPSKAVPEQQGPDPGKRGSEQGRSTLTACLPGTRCGMMAEAPVEED